MSESAETLIGVISDTHGLLRAEAIAALRGCDLIVHAGDVGSPDVLDRLGELAPVRAVRGNIDTQSWARRLPETEVVEAGALLLWVLHDIAALDLDPAAGFAAVIFGHSHKPSIEMRSGALYFNPGSAGPRRFKLPISLARLTISGARVQAKLVTLEIAK